MKHNDKVTYLDWNDFLKINNIVNQNNFTTSNLLDKINLNKLTQFYIYEWIT